MLRERPSDLRVARRQRALDRFADELRAAGRAFSDVIEATIRAAIEYEAAIAADPIAGEVATPATGGERILKKGEAARYLGISVAQLDDLTRHRRLASISMPSGRGHRPRAMYEQSVLDEFKRANRVPASVAS